MNPSTASAIALEFVRHINAHDVVSLARLMTEDHRFIDATGTVHPGRAAMTEGWKKYFDIFPNYRVEVEQMVAGDDLVALFGTASGAFQGEESGAFQIPVAWKATVRDGSLAEWRVYCDVEPMLKAMGKART